MSDCELLYGQALSDRIRAICSEDEVDCAVAFWSSAVRDNLFPRWITQKVRIICDISMGCNSRKTLEAYGAPENILLKVSEGLHAKIFISSVGAVVGSANASLNGVGLEDTPARNMEAGVYAAPGSPVFEQAKLLFADLWKSPLCDKGQLDRVPEFASDPGKRITQLGPADPSILNLVRGFPERFEGTLFISDWEEIESDERIAADQEYAEAEITHEFEPAQRELIIRTDHEYYPVTPNKVLFLGHEKRGGNFELSAYSDIVSVKARDVTSLWGIENWGLFWKTVDVRKPKQRLSALDQARVMSIEDGVWAMTADRLAGKISE